MTDRLPAAIKLLGLLQTAKVSTTSSKVSPEIVSCKDVHFKATCPGDVVGVDGVGKNFLGAATDCFMGDAVKIEPLACKVDQVSVRIRDVRACGE